MAPWKTHFYVLSTQCKTLGGWHRHHTLPPPPPQQDVKGLSYFYILIDNTTMVLSLYSYYTNSKKSKCACGTSEQSHKNC